MSRRRFSILKSSFSPIFKLNEVTLAFNGYSNNQGSSTLRNCFYSFSNINDSSAGGRFGIDSILEPGETYIRFGITDYDNGMYFIFGFTNGPLVYGYAPDGISNVSRSHITCRSYPQIQGLTEYKGSGYKEVEFTNGIYNQMTFFIDINTTIQFSRNKDNSYDDGAYISNTITCYTSIDCLKYKYNTPY